MIRLKTPDSALAFAATLIHEEWRLQVRFSSHSGINATRTRFPRPAAVDVTTPANSLVTQTD